MATVRQKAYAKVNLFLSVIGKKEDYHLLDTVVSTIDLFDTISISTRRDNKITVRSHGNLVTISEQKNNAYKAALLFQETFKTSGVDIVINKKIPVAGGLGGSSTDASATLVLMEKLFSTGGDLKALADKLGSDTGYLLTGGLARLKGRGEEIFWLDEDNFKLNLIIALPKHGVNTAECFKMYDECHITDDRNADTTIKNLSKGCVVKEDFYNALYYPAIKLNPDIERVYGLIEALSPKAVCMSGSGSAVFGVFETRELCLWAKDKLKKENLDLYVTETVNRNSLNKPLLKNPFIL